MVDDIKDIIKISGAISVIGLIFLIGIIFNRIDISFYVAIIILFIVMYIFY